MDYATAVKRVNMDDDLGELVSQVRDIAVSYRLDYISPYAMVVAAAMSGIEEKGQTRLRNLIAGAGLPTTLPDVDHQALRDAMKLDKKVQAKKIRFVLLRSLGADDVDARGRRPSR